MQLNSAEDREKYRIMLDQISVCMSAVEEQQEIIKEIIDASEATFGVDKKTTRNLAKVLHKANYEDVRQSFETLESLYELITKSK